MRILKPALAIAAMLNIAYSQAVPPMNRTISKPTPVLEKRWMETNCRNPASYDLDDYDNAVSNMDTWLGSSGQYMLGQTKEIIPNKTAEVYICNNEDNNDIQVYSSDFSFSMTVLDSSCGVGVAGWTRDHRHNVDISIGRDESGRDECGF